MPAGFFLKIFVVLVFISSGFILNIQANGSPQIFNEKFVVNALQTIHSAQATYSATVGNGNYATFEQLRNRNLIDSVLATGDKYFYHFTITTTDGSPNQAAQFQVSAVPQRYGKNGKRSFFLSESGVLRGADRNGEPANGNDPPVPVDCGESGAIYALRVYHSAQMTYYSTFGNKNYGTFSQLYEVGLIDSQLGSAFKCGYFFRILTTAPVYNLPARFEVKAVPQYYGSTGFRSFFVDESGVIRGADRRGGEGTVDDPPIE